MPLHKVDLKKGFWQERVEAGRRNGIPGYLRSLEEHGVLDNFRRLSGREGVERSGPVHMDSDLYKWVEAASYSLSTTPDKKLESELETVIDVIRSAQDEDGYLNTYFVEERADDRFSNLKDDHELYCAGHLIQAAVAHYRSTGERKLLECALEFADYLASVFGPGKRRGFSGHPELEMALVELYRTSGDGKYLDLADYLLDQLGFSQRREMKGHAVRACYACCGGADLYAETGQEGMRRALESLWSDMSSRKVYVTGGVGARHAGESFGQAYELPNLRAYSETCAAISNAMWDWRMLLLTGECRYADMMERVLYNGFLSGVSLSGDRYFYVNPLESSSDPEMGNWGHERREWFSTPCCLGNVQRMLASLPGYIYGREDQALWINLYQSSDLETRIGTSRVNLVQRTDYPWSGKVRIKVECDPGRDFSLMVRIPSWSQETRVTLENEELNARPGTYLEIEREWNGAELVLELDMQARLLGSHPMVREDFGSVAISRGPLVYCLESIDNPGIDVRRVMVGPDVELDYEFKPDVLGGIGTVAFEGLEILDAGDLYASRGERAPKLRECRVQAIPYYAWANRGRSSMLVWVPVCPSRWI